MELLNERIRQVEKLIDPILDQGFDFASKEYLEIDPKKLDFAENMEKLRERWRLSLKMQVLDSYFDALGAKGKQLPEGIKDIAMDILMRLPGHLTRIVTIWPRPPKRISISR